MRYLKLYEDFGKNYEIISDRIKECFIDLKHDGFEIETTEDQSSDEFFRFRLSIKKDDRIFTDETEDFSMRENDFFSLSDQIIDSINFSTSYGKDFGVSIGDISATYVEIDENEYDEVFVNYDYGVEWGDTEYYNAESLEELIEVFKDNPSWRLHTLEIIYVSRI